MAYLLNWKKVSCGNGFVKKEVAGFLDAIAGAASQCCGEGGICIGGSVLDLWAKICPFPWKWAYQLS